MMHGSGCAECQADDNQWKMGSVLMPNPAARAILRGSPIFAGIAGGLLDEIIELGVNRHYREGEPIFLQGDFGSALFGVIAGQIRITVNSGQGQELHVNLIEPGEIVGEIAFLDGGVRTASGTAATATTCFVVPREPFFRLLGRHPEVYKHLLMLLCERVRWTSRLVADSAFLSVRDRLAVRLANLAGKSRRSGQQPVRIRISQLELATYMGVSRQVVNGYLREWSEAGYIHVSRGSITINDLQSLLLEQAENP